MKTKNALLTLGLLLVSSVTFAQFNFGPKLGVNSSRLTLQDNVNNVSEGSSSFGFHAGAFARMDFNRFFIQPELLYTSASGELKFADGSIGNQIRQYDFNRVDLPVHFGLRFGDFFRVGAAPVLSVLVSDSQQGDINNQMRLKNSTLGYQVGVGVDLWNLVMDLRYEGNLSGVTKEVAGISTDQRLNQWTFGIGMKVF